MNTCSVSIWWCLLTDQVVLSQYLLDLQDMLIPQPCCVSQMCVPWATLLVASHVIGLHVLQYSPFQIFWDPSHNLRLLRLSPSPDSLKDLPNSLHFPASGLQIVGRSLFQLHQQCDNTVCKLSELLSLEGVKCHGILVFSGSAPHWACSCKLCIHCVRNDSCGLWHQHSGLNSTVKLPARKKSFYYFNCFCCGIF